METVGQIALRAANKDQQTNGAHSAKRPALPDSKPKTSSLITTSTAKTPPSECPNCKGMGYTMVVAMTRSGERQKAIEPCPVCKDFTKRNGLLAHEQGLTVGSMLDLLDTTGSINVLRVSAEYIIAGLGATFATVYGDTGSAKSLWAKIIVATLCRNGIHARYTRGRDVEQSLFSFDEEDKSGRMTLRRTGIDTLGAVRALVIDEAHAINWKSQWISAGIQELLDMRYERAAAESPENRQLTIFVAQHDPKEWAPDYLYDRMRQGTFSIPWTERVVPECLQHRSCPACGAGMEFNGEFLVCPTCEHERDVEIFWPFCDMAKSARPIMPSLKFGGWR